MNKDSNFNPFKVAIGLASATAATFFRYWN